MIASPVQLLDSTYGQKITPACFPNTTQLRIFSEERFYLQHETMMNIDEYI
jgi:hypothetical protein